MGDVLSSLRRFLSTQRRFTDLLVLTVPTEHAGHCLVGLDAGGRDWQTRRALRQDVCCGPLSIGTDGSSNTPTTAVEYPIFSENNES